MSTETDAIAVEGRNLLARKGTSIADLENAGWRIKSNGYTYFRHDSGAVMSFPNWVKQYVSAERREAVAETQIAIRDALGIERKADL